MSTAKKTVLQNAMNRPWVRRKSKSEPRERDSNAVRRHEINAPVPDFHLFRNNLFVRFQREWWRRRGAQTKSHGGNLLGQAWVGFCWAGACGEIFLREFLFMIRRLPTSGDGKNGKLKLPLKKYSPRLQPMTFARLSERTNYFRKTRDQIALISKFLREIAQKVGCEVRSFYFMTFN